MEGADGAGKSTQTALLCEWLKKRAPVVETREPGGTEIGEKIRELILTGEQLDGAAETLLMAAARREHIIRRILPALKSGAWVVCDRFSDSTFAYQGGGRGVCQKWIADVLREVEDGLRPALTFYLLPSARGGKNSAQNGDVFERSGGNFYRAVMHSYKKIAEENPDRIVPVSGDDATGNRRGANEIAGEIQNAVQERFGI